MIKQDIIKQSFDLGVQAERIGLYVDRGNNYQSEYRLGKTEGHEKILLGLGFMARQNAEREA